MFVAAGVADATRILTGLSWWGAVALGVALWGTAATLLSRRAQRQLADAPPRNGGVTSLPIAPNRPVRL
jgi:hypothetical protein